MEREKHGENIFKCSTCNEYGHYASKCPKRENFKGRFRSRRSKQCLYANEEEDESNQRRSEDELGFVAIKEDDLDREIREERALISQVEKKDWIIDNGCSHHMTGDMSKFVNSKAMMDELSE